MGVKSLWSLLTPVGRPVMLETVEGKTMAIDSSIWLYQFQATMRDKEGHALVNAHLLGFLRRISKLLFYGIKPVFVFDGGAPALKRSTLNERKRKKSGAASSHIKLAEKLLAAQMRREALNHTQNTRKSKENKEQQDHVVLNEDTVYLEDLEGPTTRTPTKRKTTTTTTPSSSAKKKNNLRDHDPYSLPQVDLEAALAKATKSTAPDPRLATEDELRAFIEEMRPEDFDINSPEFRELPTEVQYEIIGDLRLKSRQTSYARLHKMLQTARTPLDFSKQQINNLRQRNALTQQLLMTTDSIGTANIAIPVRIASERNREYILMKNEGADGGWILGIKDTGTREKPIILDHDEDASVQAGEDDSDVDMEEVIVPENMSADPDLRQYQRDMALQAIAQRNSSHKRATSIPRPIDRKTKTSSLNELHKTDDDDDDDLVAFALEESFDQAYLGSDSRPAASSSSVALFSVPRETSPEDDLYGEFATPSRLKTVISIANTTPNRSHPTPTNTAIQPSVFGEPFLLSSSFGPNIDEKIALEKNNSFSSTHGLDAQVQEIDAMQYVDYPDLNSNLQQQESAQRRQHQPPQQVEIVSPTIKSAGNLVLTPTSNRTSLSGTPSENLPNSSVKEVNQVDDEPDKKSLCSFVLSGNLLETSANDLHLSDSDEEDMEGVPVESQAINHPCAESIRVPDALPATPSDPPPHSSPPTLKSVHEKHSVSDHEEEEPLFAWSRTPSPMRDFEASAPIVEESWDAAEELDIHAEEGEFARFMSQVKGKNVDDIRKEIDDEIKSLNQQRKIAMRDSEDVTQQMVSQIMTMLRLFGIPYITAPMEAEAQCAELVALSLVDGVITDDSDVFLFGAQRVYKNMFNQSKTVECFLLTDLTRELGLDRDTLVQLAYLLGSDYTEGLPGIGPVLAMELLKEFPGHDGLHKFKDWWTKVQSGKDRPEDNQSKFRKQFKKKFKNLYLASDWPNSVVRDAYYHPTVDSSEEPFKWGMPDLDGLRLFLHQELGWKQSKVDELLLPIIQRMNKRNQAAALNRQGNLNEFLDISSGSGTFAPRQSRAYQSKRLQQVISDFRKQRKGSADSSSSASRSGSKDPENGLGDDDVNNSNSDREGLPAKKGKRKAPTTDKQASKKGSKAKPAESVKNYQLKATSKSKGKGKAKVGSGSTRAQGSSRSGSDEEISLEDEDDEEFIPALKRAKKGSEDALTLRPRPKPRPKPKVGGSIVGKEDALD